MRKPKSAVGFSVQLRNWIGKQGAWRRIFIFLGLLLVAWLPVAAPLYGLGNAFDYSNITEIVALVLLYAGFLIGLPRWGKTIHSWEHPWKQCGLLWNGRTLHQLSVALAIGVLGVFALFGVETLLGWATPGIPSARLLRFIVEGLVMALAVAFAEEMLFRGWLLTELEKNYSSTTALVMSAVFFAWTHLIGPLSELVISALFFRGPRFAEALADAMPFFPQFFGLVILGMALVWARRSSLSTRTGFSSLGYPIGLHAGLIWGYYMVNVGGLSEYTERVPEWVTGLYGNPLAGLLGLGLLGAIAFQFAKVAPPKANAQV